MHRAIPYCQCTSARAHEDGALLINANCGSLVDTEAAIEALKSGQLGGIAIDVHEQEAGLFLRDLSSIVIPDDVIQRLVSPPNAVITGQQTFLTREAPSTIPETALAGYQTWRCAPLANEIKP